MRILADANLEGAIVRWFRSNGHDLLWAHELPPALSDVNLLVIAAMEERVLVTNDRDFGDLVFRKGYRCPGLVLLRFETRHQDEKLAILCGFWQEIEILLDSAYFIVVGDRGLRARLIPPL